MSQKNFGRAFKRALNVTASAAILAMAASAAHALPGRDEISPDDNVDTANVWSGVGMMLVDPGFVCTGQLINARTVIYAAHCSDSFANADYGAAFGGAGMAWGFNVSTRTELLDWFFSIDRATNVDANVYNVLQVQTPFDAPVFDFPGGDVAMATLDTPVIGLPTYGLLFSPITETTEVNMVGYGTTGTGSTGDNGGLDWQRRVGNNMLDGLFSQADFLGATFQVAASEVLGVFGPSAGQILYHIDFDRPNRDENDCSRGTVQILGPSDYICSSALGGAPNTGLFTWDGATGFVGTDNINWFGGGARDLESGTAGGDSGSGLFVEIEGRQLVAGVLSGGWGFTSPFGGYGDLSYYNPLYLYQNWIIENNPYVYATAAAGDGNWSDASRWSQMLDPNYFIVDGDGNLVNGTLADAPATIEDALTTQDDRWGDILGEDVTTRPDAYAPAPAPADPEFVADSNDRGTVDLTAVDNKGHFQVQDAVASAISKGDVQVQDGLGLPVQAENTGSVASSATPGNALGALPVGWVPNNDWGAYGTWTGPASGITARFYDVALNNAGTTTVDMNVEIDQFTINNTEATLNVQDGFTFNTLIAFNHTAGAVYIDGLVNAREYLLTSGILSGTGELNTMNLWNVAGGVAPGRIGTIGEFTLTGDYTQTAAGSLWIDFGPNGTSDTITINGDTSLDGMLMVSPIAGYMPRYGDSFVFATFSGAYGGSFASVSDLPGVLRPVVTLAGGQATLELTAESFSTQTTYTNLFQASLGNALDNARDTDYAALADIFGPLDLLSGDDLADALTSLTPFESVMFDRSLRSHADTLNAALMGQIRNSGGSSAAEIAVAVQSAELQADGVASPLAASGAKMLFRHNHGGDMEASQPGLRAFGEVGYVSGDVDLTFGTGSTDLDGEFSLFGLEATFDSGWSVGAAIGMASTDMDSPSILNSISSETSTTQFSLFGGYQTERFGVSGFYSFASSETDAQRTVVMGGMSAVVASDLEADATSFGVVADYRLTDAGAAYQIVPTASLVSTEFDYDATTAQAIPGANIDARSSDSLIARMGAHFSAETNIAGLRPVLYLGVASDFGAESEAYSASFQGAPNVSFGTIESIDVDEVWYEISVSIEREFETGATLSLGAFTEEGREVIDRTGVSVGVSVPF